MTEGRIQVTYLEFFPIDTSPIKDADGATKAHSGAVFGATPSTATNLVEGTRRSVYFATSKLAPKLSRALPTTRTTL